MILTDRSILNNKHDIVIKPFNKEQLGTNSYDLTLNPVLKVYTNDILDTKNPNPSVEITIPEEGLVLDTNKVYIATTNEYTETYNHVPILADKSSLARLGLATHYNAGFGDESFKGKWTLELSCTQPIRIYPNMKICQIYYIKTLDKPIINYNNKKSAKYQNQTEATTSLNHLNYVYQM